MSKLKFNSQIATTVEQSKKLLELGLKVETADMCHQILTLNGDPILSPTVWTDNDYISDTLCPAWSLHRLIEMYVERYISCNINLKELTFDWLINEIEIHIKDEDFNKEYLKQ